MKSLYTLYFLCPWICHWSHWADCLTQTTQMMHKLRKNTVPHFCLNLASKYWTLQNQTIYHTVVLKRYWTFNISCNSVSTSECVSRRENQEEGERRGQEQEQCTLMVKQIWKNILVNICLCASTSNTCHSSFLCLLFLAGLRWAVGLHSTMRNSCIISFAVGGPGDIYLFQ